MNKLKRGERSGVEVEVECEVSVGGALDRGTRVMCNQLYLCNSR